MFRVAFMLFALAILGCSSLPEGTEEGTCSDKKDNDNNGFVDCEDKNCEMEDYCLTLAAKAAAAKESNEAEEKQPEVVPVAQDDNKDYSVVEKLWVQKKYSETDMNYAQAEKYCNRLVLAEKGGWRLPTAEEALAAYEAKVTPTGSIVIWTTSKKGAKKRAIMGISSGAINELGVNLKGDCRALCVRDDK